MLKETLVPLYGNDQYEGFGIELIDSLASKLGFNYIFKIQTDGNYGSLVNGEWNGMLRELMDDRADLAITDLTITAERESAVVFCQIYFIDQFSSKSIFLRISRCPL